MKQIKKKDVVTLHDILSASKMTKGNLAAKRALVNAIMATKEEAERFRDAERVARDMAKPENHKAMEEKAQKPGLTPREIAELNNHFLKYEAEVAKLLEEDGNKTVDVDLKPWTPEQFDALLENNDFTGGQMLFLQGMLLEEKKPETDKKA